MGKKCNQFIQGLDHLLKDDFGDWDLPGGRIKKDEFETPMEQILKRKMNEELGSAIQYTLIKPVVFMRHERQEAMEGNPNESSLVATLRP